MKEGGKAMKYGLLNALFFHSLSLFLPLFCLLTRFNLNNPIFQSKYSKTNYFVCKSTWR